ncbi:AAA family ATPase [Niveispirillum sp. BGYR6]|uniref:AAA family ATPase n=1 Tax=Niveispirillum sp. BGYR6 TaxID=2971249 RepID=UPI0022B9CF4C|nr:AAA family ATPase [Niveispirillum sp. BGYR6]MDG5497274.1 AAA family ATPase [Niveispirillum sp. BGYR6]
MGAGSIRRITLRNYKSIAYCRIDLHDLMFLVGRNGAGKSNFLDAFRFVSDALRTSLDQALRDRGGIREVRRRSGGHPTHFAIRLEFQLPDGRYGYYAFSVGTTGTGAPQVAREECWVYPAQDFGEPDYFEILAGEVKGNSLSAFPAVLPDRLALVAASGLPAFRPVFDLLSRMDVYNINPEVLRAPQKPDLGGVMRHDGSNAASVLHRFSAETRESVRTHLSRIVPGVSAVTVKPLGSYETIEFSQIVQGQKHPWAFLAQQMSDGTLRALGILLAAFQDGAGSAAVSPRLIGLEEPETALHPAAVGILLSALQEGARHRQILVTCHSPDLLDSFDIVPNQMIAVESKNGTSVLGPLDSASIQTLRDHLLTPGELLRQDQLAPDPEVFREKSPVQEDLFGPMDI